MRTLVDIPEQQIKLLTSIAASKSISRAEVIRRAIAAYVEKNGVNTEEAFGVLKNATQDGVAYQDQIRSEW